jgi:hypothetical protein
MIPGGFDREGQKEEEKRRQNTGDWKKHENCLDCEHEKHERERQKPREKVRFSQGSAI